MQRSFDHYFSLATESSVASVPLPQHPPPQLIAPVLALTPSNAGRTDLSRPLAVPPQIRRTLEYQPIRYDLAARPVINEIEDIDEALFEEVLGLADCLWEGLSLIVRVTESETQGLQ